MGISSIVSSALGIIKIVLGKIFEPTIEKRERDRYKDEKAWRKFLDKARKRKTARY